MLTWSGSEAQKKSAPSPCYIRLQMADQTSPEATLRALNIELPAAPSPGGNYVPMKRVGSVVYLSGVISTGPDGIISGTAGVDRTIEEGYAAARACALTQLAVLRRELGSLDRVAEVLTLNGYVNAAPGFGDSPEIINGASDLLVQVFGEAGRHVRAALGVSALPRKALVELQMTVRVTES
jgi:enamine deaminase RidA (YjgF/YER057c/UK114 family)